MVVLKRIGKELNLMVLIPHPLNISVLILLVEDAVRHERVRVQLRRIERRAHTLATLHLQIPQVLVVLEHHLQLRSLPARLLLELAVDDGPGEGVKVPANIRSLRNRNVIIYSNFL
jgi:hypothetical protein